MDVAHQCSWPVNRPCESLEQGAPRDSKTKKMCRHHGVVMRKIRWCSLTHWYFLCTICSSSPLFNLSIILPSNFLQKVGTMVCMVNRHSQILVIVPPGLDAWWVCCQVLFKQSMNQWILKHQAMTNSLTFTPSILKTHTWFCLRSIWIYMGVSKNRDTPKWMVYNGKSH